MNSLTLPVVHPSFQRLKKNAGSLHLTAAGLILTHAITHFEKSNYDFFYTGCLIFIAVDISILAIAARHVLTELPRVNLLFRAIEFLFFLGIATELLFREQWINSIIHFIFSLSYIYLFYCEKKVVAGERICIHHTGIDIPALPACHFLNWATITRLESSYSDLTIDTTSRKTYHFKLQHNLQFEELDQIHEFCRHYLGKSH